MSFLGTIIAALAQVISFLLTAYFWVVIAASIITWVNPDPYNPIVRFLRSATDPVLYRIRRYFPFVVVGGLDLSPVVVLLAVQVAQIVVVGNLFRLVFSMGGSSMM